MKPLQSELPSAQWVEERKNYIGGSDVGTILCENPYSTPLKLWMLKKGLIPPSGDTPITRFGHFFEPILAGYFEELTGLKTRQVHTPYTHPKHDFLRANIDRQVLADGKELTSTAVLELKTTTSHRLEHLDGDYPTSWKLQLMHYLGITGYKVGLLQVYERNTCRFHDPVIIERDENAIIENMNILIDWWKVHMIEGKRPAPINGEDALLLFPDSSDGTTVEVTPAGYDLYQELLKVRDRKADLEAMEEDLKTKLKVRMEDAERMVLAGRDLIQWKSSTQHRLDTKAFREAHPKLYRDFTKPITTRRFTVK